MQNLARFPAKGSQLDIHIASSETLQDKFCASSVSRSCYHGPTSPAAYQHLTFPAYL